MVFAAAVTVPRNRRRTDGADERNETSMPDYRRWSTHLARSAPNRAAATAWHSILDTETVKFGAPELSFGAPVDPDAGRARRTHWVIAEAEAAACDDPRRLAELSRRDSAAVKLAVAENPHTDETTARRLLTWAMRQQRFDTVERLIAASGGQARAAAADVLDAEQPTRDKDRTALWHSVVRGVAAGDPNVADAAVRGDTPWLQPDDVLRIASHLLDDDALATLADAATDDPMMALLDRGGTGLGAEQATLRAAEVRTLVREVRETGRGRHGVRVRGWVEDVISGDSSAPLVADDDARRLVDAGEATAAVAVVGGFHILWGQRDGDNGSEHVGVEIADAVLASGNLAAAAFRARYQPGKRYHPVESLWAGARRGFLERLADTTTDAALHDIVTKLRNWIPAPSIPTVRPDVAVRLIASGAASPTCEWLSNGRNEIMAADYASVRAWLDAGAPRPGSIPDDTTPQQRVAEATRPTAFTTEWASDVLDALGAEVWTLAASAPAGRAINRALEERLGDDTAAWKVAASLLPTWEGSVRDLAETSLAVASTVGGDGD